MTKPNRDLENAGWSLQGIIAMNMTQALEHIHRELRCLDGFPERGEQVAVRSSSESTSVERTVETRYLLGDAREGLRDRKRDVLESIRLLNMAINHAMRLRVPQEVKPASTKGLCCDGQQGKDGALEWADPLCLAQSTKRGLCARHYMAWRRWNLANGRDMADDADLSDALQVRVTELDNGVAVVRDARQEAS